MKRILLLFGVLTFCWTSIQAQCTSLSTPVTLPINEGFEGFTGTVEVTDSTFGCNTGVAWDYHRGGVDGRLSFTAVSHTGVQSAVLDVSTDGPFDTNYVTMTANMTNYTSTTNPIYLTFFYREQGDEAHTPDRVWARGSDTDPWIEVLDWSVTATTSWQQAVINLSSTFSTNSQSFSATTQVRWGQYDNFTWGSDGFAFDDVVLVELTCPEPTNFATSNALPGSVDLSWTTGGASNWQISYDTTGQSGAGGGTLAAINSNPYTLSGLSEGVTYDIYIRDSCGTNDVSFWVGPVTVTIPCAAKALGYTTGFELEAPNTDPFCWSEYLTGTNGDVSVINFSTPKQW